jgi:DNA polymerase-3 subunit delta'
MWRTNGQSNAITMLKNGLREGNLSHAYLLAGPPHIGKTTLAIDLAQALNCQEADAPCGQCKSCTKILRGKHTDVITISLSQSSIKNRTDNATSTEISIDEIRELQHSASLPPFEGRWKVFIIDGAERLSLAAANCLLKVLEEPPPCVMIILLTENETEVLATIISRCLRVELKPISNIDIERILVEINRVASDKAKLLSRLSNGRLGWAIMAAADDTVLSQRSQRLSSLFSLLKGSWEERFTYVVQVENDKKAVEETLKIWLTWCRDLMLVKCDCRQAITNADSLPSIEEWIHVLCMEEIKIFIESLQNSLEQIDRNANLRLILEVLMLDMPKKERKEHGAISMSLLS